MAQTHQRLHCVLCMTEGTDHVPQLISLYTASHCHCVYELVVGCVYELVVGCVAFAVSFFGFHLGRHRICCTDGSHVEK